jgi:hypothetical protein
MKFNIILFYHASVGSRDLRQMSEYPITHGGQYHFYILRRWRPAFLHPKGERDTDLSQG